MTNSKFPLGQIVDTPVHWMPLKRLVKRPQSSFIATSQGIGAICAMRTSKPTKTP
ncbi:hypothetical protein Mal52_31450 [Symmachiella dynata]|uniref:Uncharacterized protein n=1 Tax=Symmachiella dynata TaxID=2527995 RepID=A0A517ZQA0_9PLAN|nr:hypothetical protein Mal52_31450 [Symmachiella dynata]